MRIVAGEWRGRRIEPPRDARVRPTADRVREAWLSIVQDALPGARVVDLCAASGALGIEALSRGAVHATFVDVTPAAVTAIRRNLETLGADASRWTIRRLDARRVLEEATAATWDVAFADPPYPTDLAVTIAERWLAVPFATVLGVEHSARVTLPGDGDVRRYGDTAITFFRA
jgi:16S rRNA (guanine966-N2)-methyltransferase